MGRTTFAEYLKREGKLPRWLALACAAIDAGLEPAESSPEPAPSQQ